MIWRLLATATGLALGYGAVVMSRCAAVGYVWPPENGLWTCLDSVTPESFPGTLVTAIVGAVAATLVAVAWIPFIVRRRRIRINANQSLGDNLHRVAEVRGEQVGPAETMSANNDSSPEVRAKPQATDSTAPSAPPTPFDELRERVETIEEDLLSGSLTVGQVTTEWIQLLREANDLHNTGGIPTRTFREVNTRLLELPSLLERKSVKTPVG